MKRRAIVGCVAGAALALAAGGNPARGQAKADSLEAINAEFDAGYKALETARIRRLAGLAAGQPAGQAAATHELLLRTAVGAGLYDVAEPVAERLLGTKETTPGVGWLATYVNIMAEAKRGDYEQSLRSLDDAIHENDREKVEAPQAQIAVALPEAQRATLVDAYYQVLVQADRFEVARKAMTLIGGKSDSPTIRRMTADRLKQLGLVGRPAPPIAGTDLDGKAVRLEDFRGQVVLVAFWATWSQPSAEDLALFEEVYEAHYDRGLRVLSIDVDAMQQGADPSAATAAVRRHALERNHRWPTLMNLPGDGNIAAAYGVSEIPSNVLVGRDGTVVHLDLRRSNLEAKLAEALGASWKVGGRPAARPPTLPPIQGRAGLGGVAAWPSDS